MKHLLESGDQQSPVESPIHIATEYESTVSLLLDPGKVSAVVFLFHVPHTYKPPHKCPPGLRHSLGNQIGLWNTERLLTLYLVVHQPAPQNGEPQAYEQRRRSKSATSKGGQYFKQVSQSVTSLVVPLPSQL